MKRAANAVLARVRDRDLTARLGDTSHDELGQMSASLDDALASTQEAMAAKLPVLGGETDVCTIMAYGFNPEVAQWSPGHGAVCAVVESLARLTAAGGNPARARLTLQEYFEKLGGQPARWGKPLVALLGALEAQLEFGTAAIGGKDSMSGSFKDLDVPPTLVSFAIVPGSTDRR